MDTKTLIEQYNNGISLAQLAKNYGTSPYLIRKQLTDNNISIRSQKEQNKYSPQNQRKYQINDNYFKKETENMAYLLGFLAADGSVIERTNILRIALAEVDKEFLEMIMKELGSNYPIRKYTSKQGFTSYSSNPKSSIILEDLKKYNIIKNKTYNFKFPIILDKKYWKDFIRGYFDGDGTVCTAGKNAIRFSICAHEKDVLEHIIDFFNEQGINKINIQMKENTYYFQYSTNATKQIYHILYGHNPKLYLSRKREKYESLL